MLWRERENKPGRSHTAPPATFDMIVIFSLSLLMVAQQLGWVLFKIKYYIKLLYHYIIDLTKHSDDFFLSFLISCQGGDRPVN